MQRKETIRVSNFEYHVRTLVVDELTWFSAYERGYRPPRYPVPAHQYITLIGPHSVEIVTGVKRKYDNKEIYYDCDCVFWLSNYPD